MSVEKKDFFFFNLKSQSNVLTSDKITVMSQIYSKLIVRLLLCLNTLVSDSLDLITKELPSDFATIIWAMCSSMHAFYILFA